MRSCSAGSSATPSNNATRLAETLACLRANPINEAILSRAPDLGAREVLLTAGCLFQAVWNHRAGLPPAHGVKDYDLFYFDDDDLSYEAEDAVIARGRTLFGDLGAPVEIRNQARVHLWYEARFGRPRPPLDSARAGVDGFLVACTALAVDVESGALYAPYGLDDLWAGVLKPNAVAPGETPDLARFRAKAESYRARWPWLRIAA